MRKTFQRLFLLLLLCVASLSVAGTVMSIDDLTQGDDCSYTLKTGYVYNISLAGLTGVTKEYVLTATGGSAMNVALRVHLGDGNNTIILKLNGYTAITAALKDDSNSYVPPLKVFGKGTLIIRHEDTSKTAYLRINDFKGGEQPAIDLSEMTGGEVRFERASAGTATTSLELQRIWGAKSSSTYSLGEVATPVIIGNPKVRIVVAAGVKVALWECVCVKANGTTRELPALISKGFESLRIEEGAELRLKPYSASSAIVKDNTWTKNDLFPAPITLAGGSLVLTELSASYTVAFPDDKMAAVRSVAKGQGVVLGKKVLTVSTKSGVVPVGCVKVADGQTLDEKERTTDANGRLVIDATKSPELVYAPSETESEKSAVTLFDLVPTVTANGCTVDSCFGIAEFKVNQVINSDFASTLKISVDLPTETAQSRSFYLRVLQTSPGGVTSTIYPAFPTTFAALTTFTRDAAGSSRFSASIPCRITPSLGTTSITVRAYATPPTQ